MNLSILSAFIFVAVFALVVFIHEFGHFIVARLLKVEVFGSQVYQHSPGLC